MANKMRLLKKDNPKDIFITKDSSDKLVVHFGKSYKLNYFTPRVEIISDDKFVVWGNYNISIFDGNNFNVNLVAKSTCNCEDPCYAGKFISVKVTSKELFVLQLAKCNSNTYTLRSYSFDGKLLKCAEFTRRATFMTLVNSRPLIVGREGRRTFAYLFDSNLGYTTFEFDELNYPCAIMGLVTWKQNKEYGVLLARHMVKGKSYFHLYKLNLETSKAELLKEFLGPEFPYMFSTGNYIVIQYGSNSRYFDLFSSDGMKTVYLKNIPNVNIYVLYARETSTEDSPKPNASLDTRAGDNSSKQGNASKGHIILGSYFLDSDPFVIKLSK